LKKYQNIPTAKMILSSTISLLLKVKILFRLKCNGFRWIVFSPFLLVFYFYVFGLQVVSKIWFLKKYYNKYLFNNLKKSFSLINFEISVSSTGHDHIFILAALNWKKLRLTESMKRDPSKVLKIFFPWRRISAISPYNFVEPVRILLFLLYAAHAKIT
jgi:hypothetical protein